jgi:hypothetical protein
MAALSRRDAIKVAASGGLGAGVIAAGDAAAAEPNWNRPAIIHKSGREITSLAGPASSVFTQVVDFAIESGGGGWQTKQLDITPTPVFAWDYAVASLIGWELRFHGNTPSEIVAHNVHDCGVIPWLMTDGARLLLNCGMLIRDENGQSKWNGNARVCVNFYKKNP